MGSLLGKHSARKHLPLVLWSRCFIKLLFLHFYATLPIQFLLLSLTLKLTHNSLHQLLLHMVLHLSTTLPTVPLPKVPSQKLEYVAKCQNVTTTHCTNGLTTIKAEETKREKRDADADADPLLYSIGVAPVVPL